MIQGNTLISEITKRTGLWHWYDSWVWEERDVKIGLCLWLRNDRSANQLYYIVHQVSKYSGRYTITLRVLKLSGPV